MRNILLILLLPVLLVACSKGGDVEITFNVSNKKSNELKFLVLDEQYTIGLDESGRGVKKISIPHETYAYVYSNNRSFTIYLTPDKNIDVSFDANDRANRIFIYCDDKGINSYLATERNISYNSGYSSYRLDEKTYLNNLEFKIKKKREFLKSKKLPEAFTKLENERIAYKVVEDIFFYPVYRRFFAKKGYKSSDKYNKYIDSLFVERPDLLNLQPYKDFLIRYIEKKTLKTRSSNKTHLSIIKHLDYVIDNVNSKEISDFLINAFAFSHIRKVGVAGNEDIIKKYLDNVRDSRYRKKFSNVVERFRNLEKGKPAPDFSFKDTKDKEVSLKDLKGKYVYIDVWATWCSSCKGEIKYFHRLIREYRNKNIIFIGISLDENHTQWKYFTEKRKLKSIQLYAGDNKNFSDEYLINTIPRFILIDKEGNIVDSFADRPSSRKIRMVLNNLPGI